MVFFYDLRKNKPKTAEPFYRKRKTPKKNGSFSVPLIIWHFRPLHGYLRRKHGISTRDFGHWAGITATNCTCHTPGGNFRTPYDRTRTKHKLTYRKRVPSINKYPLKQSAAAGNQISDGRYICLLQLWAKSVRLIVCVS